VDKANVVKWLESVPFYRNFDKKELGTLAEKQNLFLKFNENDQIIEEGDTDQAFYIIIQGTVRITKTNRDNEITLTKLNTGAVFGEMSLLRKGKRTSNAIAEISTVLMEIKPDDLNDMEISLQVKFQGELLKVVMKRFETLNNKYTELLSTSKIF